MLPFGGSILLPIALCLSEAVASASVVPHYASFYLGFLSWSCEKAEMQLSKQAGTLNVGESQIGVPKIGYLKKVKKARSEHCLGTFV